MTQGGQQPDSGPHDTAAAACFALGRVLANEHPALKPRRIDLVPGAGGRRRSRRLTAELLAEGDAEAGGDADRPRPAGPPAAARPAACAARPPARALLRVRQPGQLGTLHWAPLDLPHPRAGEVSLRVDAAGMNFRDLMWAQGLLPEEALLPGFAGPGLGMECAGVVEAVGPGEGSPLRPRRPGLRRRPAGPGDPCGHPGGGAGAAARRHRPVAAATIPVAFLTAVHGLEELARIEPGERVLVHGGAGAVGLAALQVALARGARVAATAGIAAKRAFLRAAGAELVLDSRDAGFADALRADGGHGRTRAASTWC